MTQHLLDTSVVAGYLNDRSAAVTLIEPWLLNRDVATSILVYGEVIEFLKGGREFEIRRETLRRFA